MEILKDAQNRTEYKRRWQLMNRASGNGVNFALVDAFYKKALSKGYDVQTARQAIFYAARCGMFGLVNAWER